MEIVALILAIIGGLLFYYGPLYTIRVLARIHFRWTFNPAQTFALVVTEEDETGNGKRVGGNIVDVLHAVPGKTLVQTHHDPLEWYFDPSGEDPRHSGFLYKKLGVQDMGDWFRTLRWNVDKRMRFAREDDKPSQDLRSVTKVLNTQHVFFSGDMTVVIKGADTADWASLHFEIDIVFERRFPVKSVLRLPDAAAFLTSLVETLVNRHTTSKKVEDYYGGPKATANREKLAKAIDENKRFKSVVLKELGLDITAVSIRDVDTDQAYKDLLGKELKAKKEAAAQMIGVRQGAAAILVTARANAQKGKLENQVAAERITSIIRPAAETPLSAHVFAVDRRSQALEKNTTIATYAPGAETVLPLDGK